MTVVQARVLGGQDLVAGLETVLEGEDDGPIKFGGLGTERWG